MTESRIDRQLADFELAATELLAEMPRWKFWKRKQRANVEANLDHARRQAEAYRAESRERSGKRKLKGIVG